MLGLIIVMLLLVCAVVVWFVGEDRDWSSCIVIPAVLTVLVIGFILVNSLLSKMFVGANIASYSILKSNYEDVQKNPYKINAIQPEVIELNRNLAIAKYINSGIWEFVVPDEYAKLDFISIKWMSQNLIKGE